MGGRGVGGGVREDGRVWYSRLPPFATGAIRHTTGTAATNATRHAADTVGATVTRHTTCRAATTATTHHAVAIARRAATPPVTAGSTCRTVAAPVAAGLTSTRQKCRHCQAASWRSALPAYTRTRRNMGLLNVHAAIFQCPLPADQTGERQERHATGSLGQRADI